ncbi:MAG TPA: serine/threonine-protein kinase, partial [Terriglobia bacterium]|nr:serine/threonine-protein kinase [Terriglobia bacterium]
MGVWSEGTLIRGKYRIISKIGVGGMAAVFKAMHIRFEELRALKVISAELASDPSFVKRLQQEAVVTRRLQHPNAVRVEDIDEAEDGRPFIVMEYIEGRSLKDLIEEAAPLSVPRTLSIIKQAASALDAAHALGILHRDIKPAN